MTKSTETIVNEFQLTNENVGKKTHKILPKTN